MHFLSYNQQGQKERVRVQIDSLVPSGALEAEDPLKMSIAV